MRRYFLCIGVVVVCCNCSLFALFLQNTIHPHWTGHQRATPGGRAHFSGHPQHAGRSGEPHSCPPLPPDLLLHRPAQPQGASRDDCGCPWRRSPGVADVWDGTPPPPALWLRIRLVPISPGWHVHASRSAVGAGGPPQRRSGPVYGQGRGVHRWWGEGTLLPRRLWLPAVPQSAGPSAAPSRHLPQWHPQREAWWVAGPLHYRLPGYELCGSAPGKNTDLDISSLISRRIVCYINIYMCMFFTGDDLPLFWAWEKCRPRAWR